MPTCIAVRHVAFEDLGLLGPLLAERSYDVRYVEAPLVPLDAGSLVAADLVVILGGPIGVYEEEAYPFVIGETAAIAARLAAKKPTLGICLGAQFMAKALGATVAPGPQKEIGYKPLAVSEEGRAAGLGDFATTPVLHWHGDNFALPPGATRLAATTPCPNQAFAIGPTILGLQFHIEVDSETIETWLVGHTVELGKAGIDPRTIRSEATSVGKATAEKGRAFLARWLDGVAR